MLVALRKKRKVGIPPQKLLLRGTLDKKGELFNTLGGEQGGRVSVPPSQAQQ